MKLKEFFVKHHAVLYGFICLMANILAVVSTNMTNFPMPDTVPLREWSNFLQNHNILVFQISIFCYGLPVVLCILYTFRSVKYDKSSKEFKEIMVHIPGAYALRGTTGWISNALCQFVILLYLKKTKDLNISFILVSSLTSYAFLTILTFTFIFFSLETLNRNIVLPAMYPEGNLSGVNRSALSSLKKMFLFYFFSAAVFPSAYLGIRLFFTKRYNIEIPNYLDFVFTFLLLLIGLILTFLIAYFFQRPLKKLTESANEISRGNYDVATQICSNDEMGILGDSFNAMAKSLKEKEFMRDTFGKIVTPQVRDYLLSGNVSLGGQKLDVTVMFCDIRGFTTLSEHMQPEEVVSLLNSYFTGLEKCIASHGGVINKYIGDAVMALFGAPVPSSTHARDAYLAALDMRKSLVEMNKSFAQKGMPEIHFGIGLHSGPVLAGNIGASSRMEYTVIGDTVNTASRIEGLCKTYKTDLLISESTALLIGKELAEPAAEKTATEELVFVAESEIRGRKEKVKLYTQN
ncbi:MAG: adenylate/guanylate cyclase domain-containing protein [Treponema sp.]|nr:adenylate/guanylate cyclase domain-containing protein [Treponema sp.]